MLQRQFSDRLINCQTINGVACISPIFTVRLWKVGKSFFIQSELLNFLLPIRQSIRQTLVHQVVSQSGRKIFVRQCKVKVCAAAAETILRQCSPEASHLFRTLSWGTFWDTSLGHFFLGHLFVNVLFVQQLQRQFSDNAVQGASHLFGTLSWDTFLGTHFGTLFWNTFFGTLFRDNFLGHFFEDTFL